jgi:hypothetical protein
VDNSERLTRLLVRYRGFSSIWCERRLKRRLVHRQAASDGSPARSGDKWASVRPGIQSNLVGIAVPTRTAERADARTTYGVVKVSGVDAGSPSQSVADVAAAGHDSCGARSPNVGDPSGNRGAAWATARRRGEPPSGKRGRESSWRTLRALDSAPSPWAHASRPSGVRAARTRAPTRLLKASRTRSGRCCGGPRLMWRAVT